MGPMGGIAGAPPGFDGSAPMGPMGPMGGIAGGPPGMPGMAGMPGMPGATGAAAEPVTLLDFAKKCFREGNDKDGFDYLCAHYLCNDKEADDLKNKIKWAAGLKRPVLAVRIGIGINYVAAPSGFAGDPQPIGRVKELPAAGAGGGGAGYGGGEGRRGRGRGGAGGPGGPAGMMPGMPPGGGGPGMPGGNPGGMPGGMPGMPGAEGAGPGSDGRGQVDYYTGEFGTKLIEALESRIMDGKFGEVLKDFDGPGTAAAGNGGFGGPQGMMPGMPGGGGPGMPAGMPGGMPGAPGGAGGAATAAGPGDPKGILPGLVVLGTGTKDALQRKAERNNLDLLFIFDVKVTQNLKTEIVNNTCALKLYAVQKPGEVLLTSASLNSIAVTKTREKGKDKDPVDYEIEKAMNLVDKSFVVSELPALQPQHALQRVTRISSSQETEPLAHLVEIRAYKAMTLINSQQYQDGVKGLIGPEKAETLLKSGKEEDRKPALAGFLPRKRR